MAVPKATVDEDHSFVLGQHDVGVAIETVLDTKTQTLGEQKLAHHHLGLGVSALHGSHASTALLRCHRVSHVPIKPNVQPFGSFILPWLRRYTALNQPIEPGTEVGIDGQVEAMEIGFVKAGNLS